MEKYYLFVIDYKTIGSILNIKDPFLYFALIPSSLYKA